MSIFKYISRIDEIDRLIQIEKTGCSSSFAHRLGISRSLLMLHLRELREDFGAPICFCRKRQTFYYNASFSFKLDIVKKST